MFLEISVFIITVMVVVQFVLNYRASCRVGRFYGVPETRAIGKVGGGRFRQVGRPVVDQTLREHFGSSIGEEGKEGKEPVRVKVVNKSIEPYHGHGHGMIHVGGAAPALAFDNHEMDNHHLFVKALDRKDRRRMEAPVQKVTANQYSDVWDNIPEYTLGTLYPKGGGYDGYRFTIELDIDAKTLDFITECK
jgi:hypothetical protein